MKDLKNTFVGRWYEEVWNQGKEETIDELFHPEGIAHGLGGSGVRGPAGFKPFFYTFRNDFSDIKVTVEEVVTEGDLEVARCHVTGVHNSTGKKVEFTGMSISKLKDGKMIEGWNNFDFLTMNQQIMG